MKCLLCKEGELEPAEMKKWEQVVSDLLPLQPMTCSNCEKRLPGLTDPIWTRNRIIVCSSLGVVMLLLMVMMLFGGGEEKPKKPEPVSVADMVIEEPEDQFPEEDLMEDFSNSEPVEVSARVLAQLERNRAKTAGLPYEEKPVVAPIQGVADEVAAGADGISIARDGENGGGGTGGGYGGQVAGEPSGGGTGNAGASRDGDHAGGGTGGGSGVEVAGVHSGGGTGNGGAARDGEHGGGGTGGEGKFVAPESDSGHRANGVEQVQDSVAPAQTTPTERSFVTEKSRAMTAVSLQAADGGFSIVVEADGPITDHAMFANQSPNKLVVDLVGDWRFNSALLPVLQVDGPLVRRVRIGRHDSFMRLVLDLKSEQAPTLQFTPTATGLTISWKTGG